MPTQAIVRLPLALFALLGSVAYAQSALTMTPFVAAEYAYIVDADGNKLDATSDPGTLIYSARGDNPPLLAPDGHHLTLGEFDRPQGLAVVSCSDAGTHLTLSLSGLVPNGMYTLWNIVFQEPGFDGTMSNAVGLGSFGANDGSDNAFTASPSGTGSISVVVPAGPLSNVVPPQPEVSPDETYVVGSCLLEEYQFHIDVNYHADGEAYGGFPGPAGTWAIQAAIGFPE